MSYLLHEDNVQYECSCGALASITRLYFCRHCLKLRCRYCVCHEADSYYCSNCLESLPPSEAKLKKHRCNTCYDCPNCFNTLSVRATTKNTAEGPGKTPSKHYYLACFFCRWTTRDVGLPDQTIASGNWPVKEHPHEELLTSNLDYFKLIALKERNEKEKKIHGSHRSFSSYTEKYGLTSMIARKRAGLPSLPLINKDINPSILPCLKPCEAVEEVEPLPSSFFTNEPDLTQITTIAQRHANPMLQPETMPSLHPQRRQLCVKVSQRCRTCEHNVSKPEFTPGSIKFKIQLSAFYHVPEAKVISFEPFISGNSSDVVIKFTNPTQHVTSIEFSPYQKPETIIEKNCVLMQNETKLITNATIELPSSSIILPPRDVAAEYDEPTDTQNFKDDPKVVWRKGNKAAVKFRVTTSEKIPVGTDVLFAFSFEYGYINTIVPTLESRSPQRSEVSVNVFAKLGQTVV